ncbi:recombinase family protein [Solibaculum mannosilyticum]|uniref:Recombinase family protein n=1 Tax=Solibaculum mannosilyticum TaxID=2780922 RepID=A0A7I8D8G8_9FIRM|nr:recombinase family protein [Solibaculum mannosilyticum]BCI61493.1 hypothetical protein C12CBH8_21320 [Solibaculum mannosilyticum]
MRIAAYCRVSTDKEDQLNSLEAQKKFFEEFARKNGHQLLRVYADEGISGTKVRNRRAFLDLMEQAEKREFDMVVVKDISRFARNTVDLLTSTRRLKALGIEMLFLTSNQTVLGNSEFVLTVFGALAQEESANTSKRVKFGKKCNAQKGKVPNLVFGYDKINGDYFHLRINQREAQVVRQIFHLYVEEGMGAAKIASVLNGRGECTKRGYDFSQNAVARILRNPIYVGKVVNGRQEVVDFLTSQRQDKDPSDWMITDSPELRIVEDSLFEAAQAVLSERGKAVKGGRKPSNRHLFSTLIRCSHCGHTFRRFVRTYRNTTVRWICGGRNAKGADSCPNSTSLDEAQLEQVLLDYLRQTVDTQKEVDKAFGREIQRLLGQERQGANHKMLEETCKRLKRTREKCLDLYENGIITLTELQERTGRILRQLGEAQEHLERMGDLNFSQNHTDAPSPKAMLIPGLLNNTMVKSLIESISVDKEGQVDVYFRPLS